MLQAISIKFINNFWNTYGTSVQLVMQFEIFNIVNKEYIKFNQY